MLLQVRRYLPGNTADAHGNTSSTHESPESWEVYGLAPGASEEPAQSNRDLSLIAWTVYAPVTDAPSERDLVVVDGNEYAIEGRPADWTRGPWLHPTAGVVVELKRTEG